MVNLIFKQKIMTEKEINKRIKKGKEMIMKTHNFITEEEYKDFIAEKKKKSLERLKEFIGTQASKKPSDFYNKHFK